MQHFLMYLLKVAVCYAAIYLFYALVLRRLTFYRGNRIFFLVTSLAAWGIPLLHFNVLAPKGAITTAVIHTIPDITGGTTRKLMVLQEGGGDVLPFITGLLIAGAVLCALRLFIQFLSLQRLTAKARLTRTLPGIAIYHLEGNGMPFSFGNKVYVNETRHTAEELEKIIRHESIHVRQKHTFDVLIMEVICILNWYNPFAWLIKKAVKQNLEFLADDAVIQNGADKKNYQYLLLKTTGYSGMNLASPLSFSSLKNRIYMMNKTKNSKKHIFKFGLLVPVLLIIILAFRNDGAPPSSPAPKDPAFQLSKVTYAVNDPAVKELVEKTKVESGLQAGKPFTVTSMKNERDRLEALLEKNGYGHITHHTITFLVDSSLTSNSFAVQVNITLQEKVLKEAGKNQETEGKAPPGTARDPLQAKK